MDRHLSQGTVWLKEMSGNEDTHLLYHQCRIFFFFFFFIYIYIFFIYRGTTAVLVVVVAPNCRVVMS